MPLQSDVTINVAKFSPKSVSKKTAKLNEDIIKIGKTDPNWWDIGAAEFRQMREDGKTAFPKPIILPEGQDIKVPSRESDRSIPCRLFHPASSKPKGVILHIHGGGWVLMSHRTSDPHLKLYADISGCAVISAGYRLAPEHPFPAGPEDCFDVAEYLIKNAEKEYGGPVKFMGGESAGGHLSVLTAFHILRTFPNTPCPTLLLHFGAFDLSFLPQCFTFGPESAIIDQNKMKHFIAALCPNTTTEQLKDPKISPFYENLEVFRGRLPKALFTCGTADPLLDDSVMMGCKWLMAGGEAVVKIYEGAPHAFISMRGMCDEADQVAVDLKTFIEDCLGIDEKGSEAEGVLKLN